jgi:ABC-type nickel/cobalt efflux system permease component RcnA
MLVGLVIAFFWGAGHALSPGHGKAVVAAYLVGTRGTAKHAAILGLTVTISHTIGVFALGLVVLFAANFIVPDTLYPILGVASGLLIVCMGLVLFAQRFRMWRASRPARSDSHTHDHQYMHTHGIAHDHHKGEHAHEHRHSHGDARGHSHDHEGHGHHHLDPAEPHSHGPFGKPHTHAPSEGRVTMGGLLALGITGGIIPCPTALVVLLAAIAYHRVALGLAWILAFSLGLAAVLTGLGLLVVYGKGLVARFDRSRLSFGSGMLARLPMASALVVAILGFLIALQSLQIR